MGWARRFNDVERYDPAKNTWTIVTRIKGSYLEKPVLSSHEGNGEGGQSFITTC